MQKRGRSACDRRQLARAHRRCSLRHSTPKQAVTLNCASRNTMFCIVLWYRWPAGLYCTVSEGFGALEALQGCRVQGGARGDTRASHDDDDDDDDGDFRDGRNHQLMVMRMRKMMMMMIGSGYWLGWYWGLKPKFARAHNVSKWSLHSLLL